MEHALDSFFQEQTWLRALARSLVRDDAEAEDLVQETWLAALENPPQDPENPRPWLRVVIQRLALRRMNRRELELSEPDDRIGGSALPEAVAARWEANSLLHEAIDSLPEGERAVILLRYQEEASLEAIARTLRVSQRTVSERLRSARERLRVRLGENFGEEQEAVPAWLAALAPLMGVDEWVEAVALRFADIAATGGRLASGTSLGGASVGGALASGALWKALAAGSLLVLGCWFVPQLNLLGRGSQVPAPSLPSPQRATEWAAGLPSSGLADSLAAAPVAPAAVSERELAPTGGLAGPAEAEETWGRLRLDLEVQATGGSLRGYTARLQAPGVPAYASTSSTFTLRGTASVAIPRYPTPAVPGAEADPITLVLEPTDPTDGSRPRYRLSFEPEAFDATIPVELDLDLVDVTIDVAGSVLPDARSVSLRRVAREWARPPRATGPWTVGATVDVRRGSAVFRDVPAGTYAVELHADGRDERGDDIVVVASTER